MAAQRVGLPRIWLPAIADQFPDAGSGARCGQFRKTPVRARRDRPADGRLRLAADGAHQHRQPRRKPALAGCVAVNAALDWISSPANALRGELAIPGDKSVSHRAIMLAAIAEGTSRIRGFLEGAD